MDKKPRLLIVSPSWDQLWWSGGKVLAPPLALPLLAGLTPTDIAVRLVDEHVEPTDTKAEVDAVAISCMTASASRAYEIADSFRDRGVPVVMGGIHPTVMPDEAALHADAVVVGEAEPVWGQILADLAGGSLQARYQGTEYCDMVGLPLPRRGLLPRDRYLTMNVVQTARGCPHGCTFCSVWKTAGRRYRFRPVEEVVEEVSTLRGWVGLVDDNITGNPARAKELFRALIPLKISWVGQADLNMAKDLDLLRLAVLSGCKALFVGLESISQENLRATHKGPNVGTDMAEAIATIHRSGIEMIGSFVLGLDADDQSIFARTVQFAQRQKLAAGQFAVLTPFPGTVIREQLEQEGRILDHDWSHYTMSNVVFRPKNMTPAELHQGRQWTYRTFYSLPSIAKRCLTWRGQYLLKLAVNWSYHRIGNQQGLVGGLPSS